jgi:HSP20 family molecular chaperone IbpA
MKAKGTKLGILGGTIAAALCAGPIYGAAPTTSGANAANKETPPAATAKGNENSDKAARERWNDHLFDEIQRLDRQMDSMFNDAMRDFNTNGGWLEEPGFTSSVKLSENQDNYVIRVSLPDRDLSKVKATVEGDRTLHITAGEEKKESTTSNPKNGAAKQGGAEEFVRYEQILTLPGPVDASKLQTNRTGNMLTITVPKTEKTTTPGGKS